MKLASISILGLSAFTSLVCAQDIPDDEKFDLQVIVKDGQPAAKNRFNGTYIRTTETGTDSFDLTTTPVGPEWYWLNGTYLQQPYGIHGEPRIPYMWHLDICGSLSLWNPTVTKPDYPEDLEFYFDEDNFLQAHYKIGNGAFHSWRVCDWWDGYPQLFWAAFITTPKNVACARVNLLRIPKQPR